MLDKHNEILKAVTSSGNLISEEEALALRDFISTPKFIKLLIVMNDVIDGKIDDTINTEVDPMVLEMKLKRFALEKSVLKNFNQNVEAILTEYESEKDSETEDTE